MYSVYLYFSFHILSDTETLILFMIINTYFVLFTVVNLFAVEFREKQ